MSLITISGPSGAGKSTLMHSLCAAWGCLPVPSWTTRPARSDQPVEMFYKHVGRAEYLSMLRANNFLLSEEVAEHIYGTCAIDIERALHSPIMWIADLTARSVSDLIDKGYSPSACIIVHVSKVLSEQRMMQRGDSRSDIMLRLQRYREELANCETLRIRHPVTLSLSGELARNELSAVAISAILQSL